MRKVFGFIIVVACILGVACEQCSDCSSLADQSRMWNDGDSITIVNGTARYNEVNYTAGDVLVIVIDSTKLDDNRRFEGDAQAELKTTVCGSGRSYDDEIATYERNSWTCKESTN